MKILITGGLGFIGQHLARHLQKKNSDIIVYDNVTGPQDRSYDVCAIKTIKGDILDYEQLLSASKKVDVVVHLAAQISVAESMRDPDKTMRINVVGTQNLLRACRENSIQNFVAASTAAVYGNQDVMPINEKSKTKPISPYGKSKLRMEETIAEFSKKEGLNTVILRLFNVYGHGQSLQYAGVITKFVSQIRKNRQLVIYGSGNQTRDFVHIDDVVNCIGLAITKTSGMRGEVYNVDSSERISVMSLAEMLIGLSKKSLPIKFEPEVRGDILHSQADIKARDEVGFEPTIKLRDGLQSLLRA